MHDAILPQHIYHSNSISHKSKKHGGNTYVSPRAYIYAIIRAGGVNSLWNFKLEKVGEFMRFRLHQGFPYVQIAIFFQMGKAILPLLETLRGFFFTDLAGEWFVRHRHYPERTKTFVFVLFSSSSWQAIKTTLL